MSDPKKNSAEQASPEESFLAATSHEIRTPLNGILGTVSLLLETELAPAQREYAEAIRLSGTRLLDLLNNVLDYARLDAEAVAVELENFKPVNVAQEVAELLSPRAHSVGLDLAVRATPRPMPEYVGDAGRVRQILFNLVGNALKFTETGAVLIDIIGRKDGLLYRVIDTGPGIAEDDRKRLFEAFRQSANKDAYKDGGVGLGLAIVQRLTDLLGGTVSVTGEPGLGTAFSVFLPFKRAAGDRPQDPAPLDLNIGLVGLPPATCLSTAAALAHAGAGAHLFDTSSPEALAGMDMLLIGAELPEADVALFARKIPTLVVLRPEDRGAIGRFRDLGCDGWLVRPLRASSLIDRIRDAHAGSQDEDEMEATGGEGLVLIADDNPVNALIARRALESAGFTVTVAATGSEALDAVAALNPALVLMDLRMPVMDGFEAIRRIRASGNAVPVIAVSAEVNPDIERRVMSVGADGVAAKPLDAEAMRRLAIKWTRADKAGAA